MTGSAARGAESRAAAPHLAGRRILFLGAAYHPLSVACLDALARQGATITVVADDSLAVSVRAAVVRIWRRRGPQGVARRVWLVTLARLRIFLRRLGLALPGAASLREICLEHGLEPVACPDPNSRAFVELVRSRQIEVIVMANYAHILRRHVFTAPPYGAVNVHPSVLPAYRGPDPIYWMLARGSRSAGVTIHQVDDGVDTGPILAQRGFEIGEHDDERTVLIRSSVVAGAILPAALELLLSGRASLRPQPAVGATYFPPSPRGASAL